MKTGRNAPLSQGASGEIRPEWLELIRDFPDRFLVGTDQHYPMPRDGTQRWEAVVRFLDQLPDDLRVKLARENPSRLYPLPSGSQR